jgi:hypothetical protein
VHIPTLRALSRRHSALSAQQQAGLSYVAALAIGGIACFFLRFRAVCFREFNTGYSAAASDFSQNLWQSPAR